MVRPFILVLHARRYVDGERRCFERMFPGYPLRSWNLVGGAAPVKQVRGAGVVILGGSPYSPTPDSPCYAPALETIRQVRDANVPLIGICWGHQMMAIEAGGTVSVGQAELGSYVVSLTKDGLRDPAFSPVLGSSKRFLVNEAHGFVVDEAPPEAICLAYSAGVKHQAFRYSPNSFSFQWHPEMNAEDCITRFKANRDSAAYLRRLLAPRVPNAGKLTWDELVKVAEDRLFSDTPIAETILRKFLETVLGAPAEEAQDVQYRNEPVHAG